MVNWIDCRLGIRVFSKERKHRETFLCTGIVKTVKNLLFKLFLCTGIVKIVIFRLLSDWSQTLK